MTEASDRSPGHRSLYRAVWRWHFYAGLIVLPFLLWLAVTGGLYLYKLEVESLVYAGWDRVPAQGQIVPMDRLVASVERQAEGEVVQIMKPRDAGSAWRMTIAETSGARRLAFVDPYEGKLLGLTSDGGVMQTVRNLHSLMIAGPIGNAAIEMVAGWAIVLVLSGLYLWWPRRGSPLVGVRGRPSGRMFWRDLHASVGVLAAAVILFLAVTGMPWTGVWGKMLQDAVASQGLGRPQRPAPPREEEGKHDHGDLSRQSLPWALQAALAPAAPGGGDVGPMRVTAIATSHGLSGPWTMTLPANAGAPYILSATIVRAQDARVLYVDGASGKILQDTLYAEFGAGARTIEWGIATHQGQQYGEPNRLVMLASCISIALLAITAPLLWWKRRRDGGLSPPPRADSPSHARAILAIMLTIGALFPLTGASMLAALLVDRLWRRARRVH